MLLAAELDLLAQMPDPLQRIRSMDAVVERFETETALKYELQIERFLPRYALSKGCLSQEPTMRRILTRSYSAAS